MQTMGTGLVYFFTEFTTNQSLRQLIHTALAFVLIAGFALAESGNKITNPPQAPDRLHNLAKSN
jgi:hypothetical protein